MKKSWKIFRQAIRQKKEDLKFLEKNKEQLFSFGLNVSFFLLKSQLINSKNELKFNEMFGFSCSNFGFIQPKPVSQTKRKNSNKLKTRLGFHEKLFGFLKVYHKKKKSIILDQLVGSKIITKAMYNS